MKKKPVKRIGILTAGGDSPGLNAAIRAVGKAAIGEYGWEIIGFRDGFRGLALNRWMRLDKGRLAGILTVGAAVGLGGTVTVAPGQARTTAMETTRAAATPATAPTMRLMRLAMG